MKSLFLILLIIPIILISCGKGADGKSEIQVIEKETVIYQDIPATNYPKCNIGTTCYNTCQNVQCYSQCSSWNKTTAIYQCRLSGCASMCDARYLNTDLERTTCTQFCQQNL